MTQHKMPANLDFFQPGPGLDVAEDKSGKALWVRIPIDDKTLESAQPSSSGKTRMVATTGGFRQMGPVSLSINCTIPNHG